MAISFFLTLLVLVSSSSIAQSKVETFTYTNEGEFGPYITEYGADYRVLPIATSPFQLAFYNTTPGLFYLALRMGTTRSESTFRWVWEFNRGNPVHENATFSLLSNGNLVLADADGRVVFSSNTVNKGVVGLKILPNGNIVLYAGKGRFVWQSFEHPTDTLLVGQSLSLATGITKLVSRKSTTDGSFGKYSLVLDSGGITMYVNNLPYYNYSDGELSFRGGSAKFECEPDSDEAFAYELRFATDQGTSILARPKYNATLSFLRLDVDGNLAVYTFYDPVDYRAWEKTFALFSDDLGRLSGCALPEKCGSFGVCEDEMCVACPSPKGLLGWSKRCSPPSLGNCRGSSSSSGAVEYYKVAGVENFLSTYTKGEGKVGLEECKRRCSVQCTCVGVLYWEVEKRCWLATAFGTLRKVEKTSHAAYVKYLK